jgi:putative ABC transport system ATP-binding protein
MGDDERTLFRRDHLGFVFQFFNLLPTLTAVENVELPAKLAGHLKKETKKRAEELLELVGLADRRNHTPDKLSGGQMQRVAVARALIMDPAVVLADEPTGNLDSESGEIVLGLLRGAVEGKRTVVLVTHDSHVAESGDRVLRIVDGRLAEDRPSQRPRKWSSSDAEPAMPVIPKAPRLGQWK